MTNRCFDYKKDFVSGDGPLKTDNENHDIYLVCPDCGEDNVFVEHTTDEGGPKEWRNLVVNDHLSRVRQERKKK